MRIKSLRIHGFKSFADPGLLSFGHGITGVVGPNGCGKSNIIDALRWVMGEMSAKHLRGKAMQDIIFAGSDSRGPSGMAEVTLTLHNDGDAPPIYNDFPEIAVTRKLHKDGNSEYQINKVPCRLRDITDLFLGTGVGTRAYSIIEQGRIGFIVQSRPEDRRSLIEEVAGITKFKSRKKAAQRRMETTETNLARVNDIVTELDRQLNSLRRQAKKAERYRTLKTELRDIDLHDASHQYLELNVLEQIKEKEAGSESQHLQDAQAAVGAVEARLEAERLRLVEEEQRLQTEQVKSAELDAQLAALERDLTHWREQLGQTEQRRLDAAAEVEQSRSRVAAAASERVALAETIERLQTSVAQGKQELTQASAGLLELESRIGVADEQLGAMRQETLEFMHEATRQRSQLDHLNKLQHDIEVRARRAKTEQGEVHNQKTSAEARRRTLEQRHTTLVAQLHTKREQLVVVVEDMVELNSVVEAAQAALANQRQELSERRSKLESLRDIASQFEGYSDGVRTLMSEDPDDTTERPAGLKGLISEAMQVDPAYEVAIEAALGDAVQYISVENFASAAQAIEYLVTHEGGRGGFVPVDGPAMESATAAAPGTVRAMEKLQVVDERRRSSVEALLGHVLVVEDLSAAHELWRPGVLLVTRHGEVFNERGVVTGGSREGAGFLARQRVIRELDEEVGRLTGEVDRATEEQEQRLSRRDVLLSQRESLDSDIRAQELQDLELQKDLQNLSQQLEQLQERLEVIDAEIVQHDTEAKRLADETCTARLAAEAAEAKYKGLQESTEAVQAERDAHAAEFAQRNENATHLKVDLAAQEEKLHATDATFRRCAAAEKEYSERIDRSSSVMDDGLSQVAGLKENIETGEEKTKVMAEQAAVEQEVLAQARARYEQERLAIVELEKEIRISRKRGEQHRETQMAAQMEMQRLRLERQKVIERVRERHDEDLLGLVTDYHLRSAPDEDQRRRQADLEKSLKNMGAINLTAIDECAEVEERHVFLTQQRDDLDSALDSLRRAIQRINRTSRERFREAFTAVNEMFQQVFPRLFRGGHARLELIEADDVLEAGVDIVAQPPGKKLQNVNLLSGGEKALTATALVFAIFLIKPSPFCVLDEVDAPLDDANVGRFNEMLREISKISQFIVITHNKLTMTEADRLYGITMQEPGMSKLVSVDFQGDEAVA